jgi:hypothetical protein
LAGVPSWQQLLQQYGEDEDTGEPHDDLQCEVNPAAPVATAALHVAGDANEDPVDQAQQQRQAAGSSKQPCRSVQELLQLLQGQVAGPRYVRVLYKWSEACGSSDLAVVFNNFAALLQHLDGSSAGSSSSSSSNGGGVKRCYSPATCRSYMGLLLQVLRLPVVQSSICSEAATALPALTAAAAEAHKCYKAAELAARQRRPATAAAAAAAAALGSASRRTPKHETTKKDQASPKEPAAGSAAAAADHAAAAAALAGSSAVEKAAAAAAADQAAGAAKDSKVSSFAGKGSVGCDCGRSAGICTA